MKAPRHTEFLSKSTPLTVAEQHFLANYIRLGSLVDAVDATPEIDTEGKTRNAMSQIGQALINKVNVLAEYERLVEEARQETLASATEVMEYFTSVMRGEIKDQFGLDASLAERTKAAQELAKRTIDIENRKQGNADAQIEIKLNWER